MSNDAVKSHGELLEEIRALRAEVAALRGLGGDLALTAERNVILVKLRYAPGWRLPGGGRDPSESPRDAILRELREEIGMTSHGETRLAPVGADELLIVRDVQYRPLRWSWEIQEVIEAPIDDLPDGVSPLAKRWLTAVRSRI